MNGRRLSVVLAGLLILSVLLGTGRVFWDRSALAQSQALFIPADSVVYQGRLTSVSAQQTGTGLRLSATANETVSFVRTPTEVLSGAGVTVSVPAFGYQAALREASTGVYQVQAQFDVSIQPSVDGAQRPMSELTQWSVVPQSGTFTLGNASVGASALAPIKLSDALTKVDVLNQALGGLPAVSGFIPNAGVGASAAGSTYQVPVSAALKAQVLDASGKPAANRRLSVTVAPDGLQAQSFAVTTDAQGDFSYDVTYPASIAVSGGTLANLPAPFQLQGTTTQQVSAFWWGGSDIGADLSQLQRNLGNALDALAEGGADPVNLVTGNMYDTEKDLGYPSPGISVNFARTYNSQESGDGPFGRGWTHSYNLAIVQQQQNGNAVLAETLPSGGREFWDAQGQNGRFVPRAGGHGTITIDQNDKTYLKTDKHGVQSHYDNGDRGGHLLWVRDTNGNQMSLGYDAAGRLATLTDTAGRATTFAYDASGHVISMTDPAGVVTAYSYDGANRLAQVKYADQSTVGYAYDGSGDLVQITDPNGAHRFFTYDARNRATSFTYDGGLERDTFAYDSANSRTVVTDAQGYQTTYTYRYIGELGVITRVVDPLGAVSTTEWDAGGNRTAVTDPLGHRTAFSYDASGNLTGATDAAGARVSLAYDPRFSAPTGATGMGGAAVAAVYDARGNATAVTDPAGSKTSFVTDARGLTASITDALGNTTTFQHDAGGNQTAVVDPMKNQVSATFDAMGHPLTATDALGRVTKIGYDAQYRPVKMTYPDGNATSFVYDAVGKVVSVTDPGGHTVKRTYNQANQLLSETDALGRKSTYAYDLRGLVRSVTDPSGATTLYTYDPDGRPLKVIRPDGSFVLLKLDLAGRLVAATDPNGHTHSYSYDPRGRLLAVADPAGGVTKYAYDAAGDVTSVTDAGGHTSSTAYDADGRPVSATNATGQTWKYAYDAAGRLVSVAYPSGQVTAYSYDANGRPVTLAYPGGLSTSYAYDAAGNVTSVTDALGATAFKYDALNRMTSQSLPGGVTLSYTYDAAGNRTSLATPSGKIAYGYDAAGQLTSVTDPLGGVTAFTYNALGEETRRTLPNGASRASTYDALGRVTEIVNTAAGGPVDSDLKYAYDRTGNIVSQTRNSAQTTYAYDALDRLAGVAYPSGGKAAYTYDRSGNRTSMTVSGMPNGPPGVLANGTTAYTYDAADRLVKAGADSLAYDADGQLVSRSGPSGTTSVTWDGRHLLTAASSPAGSAAYTYDALGRMVGRTDSLGNAQENVYDGGSLLLKRPAGAASWNLVVGAGSEPLSELGISPAGRAARQSYFETDAQGSVVGVTDRSGAASGSSAYSDFGQPLSTRESSATGVPGGSSKVAGNYQDLGYLGQPFDPISGLELFHARWYAPDLGRFTSLDPVGAVFGSPKTLNRYAYGLDNPSTFSDPSGLFIREGLDALVTSIPYVGAVYLLITAITGYDPILGRQLSPLERVINGAFGVAGLIEPIGVAAGARLAERALVRGAEQGAERAVVETGARDAGAAAGKAIGEGVTRDAEQQTTRASENALNCAVGNSFVAGTPVLMADGSQKPIDQVQVGDEVLAEDPSTGVEKTEPVTAVIVGAGEKHLVTLVIDGQSLTATDNHPFWSADRQQWMPAGQLRLGEHLQLADGRLGEVDSIRAWSTWTTVYNLSVADLHTYFAGADAVLVHNCSPTQLTRGQQFERDVLAERGLAKNGAGGGQENIGRSIPDSVQGGRIIEIKDADYVYVSRQFRDYANSGRPVDLIVGPDSKVSAPLLERITASGGQVLRRLGPSKYVSY